MYSSRSVLLFLVLLLCSTCSQYGWSASSSKPAEPKIGCIEEERRALLDVKRDLYVIGNATDDPFPSWGNEDEKRDCCKWLGIRCDNESGHVISLRLSLSARFRLGGKINPSLFELRHLTYLDLNFIDLNGSQIPSSIGTLTHLTYLDIISANLSGKIPLELANLSRLESLRLSSNNLQGSIPKAWEKLTSLTYLDLMNNQLNGSIPDIFWNVSGIDHLYLEYNMLEGEFPRSIWNLTSLTALRVRSNNLRGHVPEVMSQLKQLRTFDASRNFLRGEISEAHFSNLSELHYLDLSLNSLSLNFHADWTPPFRLDAIFLGSCKLGPQFPKWLQTQTNYSFLNVSNSGISDSIPNWFWHVSTTFEVVDLSNNQISGGIGNHNISLPIATSIDLSSNQLEGPIPSFVFQVDYLNLFENKFSKLNLICNVTNETSLVFLDVSYNSLSEDLPDCWSHFKMLEILILANNKLSGRVPSSIGSLNNILSLNLNNNKFVGELPSTLEKCTGLVVMDLGENNFSGTIPTWLGKSLFNVSILSLKSNGFYGGIPDSLCRLSNLRILDLSFNRVTGNIPKCISSFAAMRKDDWTGGSRTSVTVGAGGFEFQFNTFGLRDYEESLLLMWKGGPAEFRSTLALLKNIDLSRNKLIGEIPREITELSGLVSLNLSRNNLSGNIPAEIGRMESLDSLDFSRNRLVGQIPQSLAQIDRLNKLDLSYNNLSGKIPTGTQLQSFQDAYAGNAELCGDPLPKNCSDTSQTVFQASEEESDEVFNKGFYISMAIGFVTAFWGVCGALIFNKSFRYAYFKLLNDVGDRVYVKKTIGKAKLLRMIKG